MVPVNFQLFRVTQFGIITGQVTNSKTQQPIQGALVEVLNAEGKVIATTRTDEYGNFTIEGLLPDAYTLRVSAEGFTLYAEQVIVTAGDTTPVSIPLTLKVNVGAIVGIVTNSETNQPIQGARVVLNAQNVVAVGYTDAQGNFIINGLPTGTYTILVTADGVKSECKQVTILVNTTEEINITLIPKLTTITGIVCDIKTGARLSDILIEVLNIHEEFIADILTDHNGEYKVCELSAGIFNVKVQLSDNQSAKSLQLSLHLAIVLILDMMIDNTNNDGSPIQEFIEQPFIKITEQIIIDNSQDITIIVDDMDLTTNLQILLQILLERLIQIDIL